MRRQHVDDEIADAIAGRIRDRELPIMSLHAVALAAWTLAAGALLVLALVLVLVTAGPVRANDVGGDQDAAHVLIPSCAPFEKMRALLERRFKEKVRRTEVVRGKLRVLFTGPNGWTLAQRVQENVDWFCIVNVGKGKLIDEPLIPKPKRTHDQEGQGRSA